MRFALRPIIAVIVRHIFVLKNPYELFNDIFWPFVDLFVFGFFALSMGQKGDMVGVTVVLTNFSLWYIVMRGSIGFAGTIVNDLYDASFIGFMVTPITIYEWLAAKMFMGIITAALSFTACVVCVMLFFDLNIFAAGPLLLGAAGFLLILSSWIIGILSEVIIINFGKKASSSIYTLSWLFIMMSGALYPIKILPQFFQKISNFLPMTYVFTALEAHIRTGASVIGSFFISLGLNILYLTLSVAFFTWTMKQAKKRGLVRLEIES